MTQHWMLETHGDPIGAIRALVRDLWRDARLDGLLVAPGDTTNQALRLLVRPEQVAEVNPFRPVMTVSTARLVPAALGAHPGKRLGVLVRPCEMRALVEMVKHGGVSLDGLLTVCIDCLATLPVAEFRREADRRGSEARMSTEAVRFARQGGIAPYRFRAACQMCVSPAAAGADVNVAVLGLPVREYVVVTAGDRPAAARLPLARLCDDEAPGAAVAARETVLARAAARRVRARARNATSVGDRLPADVEGVAEMLDRCPDCGACLDECPICAVHPVTRASDRTYARRDVAALLTSCDGCGMCEQVCPQLYPLATIFGGVRDRINAAADYHPGRSVREPLPVG
jgi:formate dehydrogenase (coenzyme F420) beta subunit